MRPPKLEIIRSRLMNKARKMRGNVRYIMFSDLHAWVYVANLKQFAHFFRESTTPFTTTEIADLKRSFMRAYHGE